MLPRCLTTHLADPTFAFCQYQHREGGIVHHKKMVFNLLPCKPPFLPPFPISVYHEWMIHVHSITDRPRDMGGEASQFTLSSTTFQLWLRLVALYPWDLVSSLINEGNTSSYTCKSWDTHVKCLAHCLAHVNALYIYDRELTTLRAHARHCRRYPDESDSDLPVCKNSESTLGMIICSKSLLLYNFHSNIWTGKLLEDKNFVLGL